MHELSGCDRSSDISIVLEKPKRDMQQAMPGRTGRLYAALMIGSTGGERPQGVANRLLWDTWPTADSPLARSKPTLYRYCGHLAARNVVDRTDDAVARYLTL